MGLLPITLRDPAPAPDWTARGRLIGQPAGPLRPRPTVRTACPPRERGNVQTFKGRGPNLSDADEHTRSWLRLGAGHRAGIQNLTAGGPPTADR